MTDADSSHGLYQDTVAGTSTMLLIYLSFVLAVTLMVWGVRYGG